MLPSLLQLACRMCPLDTRGGKGDHGSQHGQHGDWRLWTPLMVHKSSRPNISLNNQTLLQCSPDPQKLIQFCHKGLFLVWAADVLCAYNPSSIKCTVWCRFVVLVTRVVKGCHITLRGSDPRCTNAHQSIHQIVC